MSTSHDLFGEAERLRGAKRYQEAEVLYKRIVYTSANHTAAWHFLGVVCLAQGKLDEAADGFHSVLAMIPDHVESMTQLGILLGRQNKLEEAVAKFRQAIELQPQYAKPHNNLGVLLMRMGKRDEGLACYKEAAKLQPDYAEAHYNLAVAMAEHRQNDEAIAGYRRALQARPDYPEALFALGMLLLNERRFEEAVLWLEQSVRLMPQCAEAYNNLCLALAEIGRFEESVVAGNEALRLRPHDTRTHANRGNALASMGRYDAAIASYDLALYLQPDYINANWNRALSLLAKGDYERGWADYESRWKKPETIRRVWPRPFWDGSSLEGKTILLWCEQGLGDMLQFVRYASLLKERGATVWLECPATLAGVLSTCRGVDRVFAEGSGVPLEFDFHVPLLSLPYLCKTTLGTIPADTPYLSVDQALVEAWRKELEVSPHFKIGIVWQGNPKHRWDQHRSFPLHWFRLLAELEGVELYNLQKDNGLDQLATVRFPIIDLRGRLDEGGGTFRETAAVLPALDLVISCDSSMAHLAGALGVPVWVAMSALSDWRWLRDREDTPWYPTMRLFRQTKLGDWRSIFERLREAVIERQKKRA